MMKLPGVWCHGPQEPSSRWDDLRWIPVDPGSLASCWGHPGDSLPVCLRQPGGELLAEKNRPHSGSLGLPTLGVRTLVAGWKGVFEALVREALDGACHRDVSSFFGEHPSLFRGSS